MLLSLEALSAVCTEYHLVGKFGKIRGAVQNCRADRTRSVCPDILKRYVNVQFGVFRARALKGTDNTSLADVVR